MHVTSPRRRAFSLAAIACLAGTFAAVSVAATGTTAAGQASGSGLSGSWSGTYGGAYSGTFKLHWTQSATSLRGSISIAYMGQRAKTTVTGKVSGTEIKFGAVGPVGVITYTGSVSGNSMSGHYTTPKGGGTWSAHKTS
jgi:hypothetical protein